MVFTLLFSLPFLLVILYISISGNILFRDFFIVLPFVKELVFLCFLVFLVKFPVFIFHFWLPRAHVEAPTFGSVILASCLLKLGTFGLTRFFHFLAFFSSLIFILGVVGIVFSSVCCFFTPDLKALIAFSSIFHMSGLCRALICGVEGSLSIVAFLSCSHGFLSSLLFFLCGGLYEKSCSRSVLLLRGAWLSSFGLFF